MKGKWATNMCMRNPIKGGRDSIKNVCYKVVIRSGSASGYKYLTPFQLAYFTNELTAKNSPVFRIQGYTQKEWLSGGAIHCYRNLNVLYNFWGKNTFDHEDYLILLVLGVDCVAYNKDEIAFRKIKVIEEYHA